MSFKFTQGGIEFDGGKLTLAYLLEFQSIIDEMSTFILNNPTVNGVPVAVWYTYTDEDGNPSSPIYMARIV